MDFLLSLSAKAKAKINNSMPENLNKSVVYADQTLSEEDVSFLFFSLSFIHLTILPMSMTKMY